MVDIKKSIAKVMLPFSLASGLFLSYPSTRAQDNVNSRPHQSQPTQQVQAKLEEKVVEVVIDGKKEKIDIKSDLNKTFYDLYPNKSLNFTAATKFYLQEILPSMESDAKLLEEEAKALYNEIFAKVKERQDLTELLPVEKRAVLKSGIETYREGKNEIDKKEIDEEVKLLEEYLPYDALLAHPKWHLITAALLRANRTKKTAETLKAKLENFTYEDAKEFLFSEGYGFCKFGYKLRYIGSRLEPTISYVKSFRANKDQKLEIDEKEFNAYKSKGGVKAKRKSDESVNEEQLKSLGELMGVGVSSMLQSKENDAVDSIIDVKEHKFYKQGIEVGIEDWKTRGLGDAEELITELKRVEIANPLEKKLHEAYETALKDPKKNADYFTSLLEIALKREIPLLKKVVIANEVWQDKIINKALEEVEDESTPTKDLYESIIKELEKLESGDKYTLSGPSNFNFYELIDYYKHFFNFKVDLHLERLVYTSVNAKTLPITSISKALKGENILILGNAIARINLEEQLQGLIKFSEIPEVDLFRDVEIWLYETYDEIDGVRKSNSVSPLELVKLDKIGDYKRRIIAWRPQKDKVLPKEPHYFTFYESSGKYFIDLKTSGPLSKIKTKNSDYDLGVTSGLEQIYPPTSTTNSDQLYTFRYDHKFSSSSGKVNTWPFIALKLNNFGEVNKICFTLAEGIVWIEGESNGMKYKSWIKTLHPNN